MTEITKTSVPQQAPDIYRRPVTPEMAEPVFFTPEQANLEHSIKFEEPAAVEAAPVQPVAEQAQPLRVETAVKQEVAVDPIEASQIASRIGDTVEHCREYVLAA